MCPTNGTPTLYRVEQALEVALRGVEIILLKGLNVRIQEPGDAQEEELVTVVADYGMVHMASKFMPRRRYRGDGCWTWRMRRDKGKVTERGD